MANYYSFVTSLPDISFEAVTSSLSVSVLKQECTNVLSERDQRLLNLYFLRFDNQNILFLLSGKEDKVNSNGVFTTEELKEYIKEVQEVENPKDTDIPSYFAKFITAYLSETPIFENLLWEDQLATLYYQYAIEEGTLLISAWFRLNLNINNIFAVLKGRELKMEIETIVVGGNEVAEALRTSSQTDFGLPQIIEYYPSLVRITEEPNLREREYKTDLFKWNWLQENTFFEYFSVDKVFTYLLQVELIERWSTLDMERGKEFFSKLVTEMTRQASDKLKEVNDILTR